MVYTYTVIVETGTGAELQFEFWDHRRYSEGGIVRDPTTGATYKIAKASYGTDADHPDMATLVVEPTTERLR